MNREEIVGFLHFIHQTLISHARRIIRRIATWKDINQPWKDARKETIESVETTSHSLKQHLLSISCCLESSTALRKGLKPCVIDESAITGNSLKETFIYLNALSYDLDARKSELK